LQNYRRSLCR